MSSCAEFKANLFELKTSHRPGIITSHKAPQADHSISFNMPPRIYADKVHRIEEAKNRDEEVQLWLIKVTVGLRLDIGLFGYPWIWIDLDWTG
jgi:hypothetical protein